MNKIKTFLMIKRPTLNDLAQPEMSKKARTVFLAAAKDARKEQARVLKKAKMLERR